ncbi:MAG: hypothetical protein LQ338_002652 [Usnochroma carphineum]|nr:MAG: hypothetical protein LQ338_002652 [Usnochroma carphineum]
MARKEDVERAVTLADQAVELVSSGRADDVSRALREAASLAPDNPKVKAAFLKIQSEDSVHVLQMLCGKYVLEQDEQAGKEALDYLNRSGQVPGGIAKECLELVINMRKIEPSDLQDEIVAGLLRESVAAKSALAKRLLDGSTAAFMQIYDIGDRSANGIAEIAMTPSAWSRESDREKVETDVFQLFLAKLLEVGHDYDGRALKGIARLLAADAGRLHAIIDDEIFDAILCSLDYRQPNEVRSQATLATAKYLELSGAKGHAYVCKFIPSRIKKGHSEDIIIAFSVAAAVFPIMPTEAAALFLTKGFVPSLLPLLEKKKFEKVEQAALNMLSAACIDNACRGAIRKHCVPWLQHVMNNGKDDRPGLAAVILAKVLDPTMPAKDTGAKGQSHDNAVDNLVTVFKKLLADPREANKQSSIEGLAYISIQPAVKEALIDDRLLLARLMEVLKASPKRPTTVFGALTVIDHLTRYLPVLSEEQKKMNQLKAYANASKSAVKPDPREEDAAVSRRCKAVVDAGAVSAFVAIASHLSPASAAIVVNIMLSLTWTPSLRGTIAQQGGARFLLLRYTAIAGTADSDKQARHTAAHALARILISVDPTLVFPSSGSPPLTSVVRPILSLLIDSQSDISDGPRNLLPIFEALLALTNLASISTGEATDIIIRQALPTIEDLLLSNNTMIQRAATELVCNLMTSAAGIEAFADSSAAANRRLHILLALADVEDVATRRAAAGAVATLTGYESVVKGILKRDRGIEILMGLCGDEDEGIVHRGLVCVGNLVGMKGGLGAEARTRVKEYEGQGVLRKVVDETGKGNQVVRDLGRQVLRELGD